MPILERRVQTIERGQWETYMAKEKMWAEIEERLGGFPTKRHYRPLSDLGTTVVWEREWESMATMEAAYGKAGADPGPRSIADVPSAIVAEKIELYVVPR